MSLTHCHTLVGQFDSFDGTGSVTLTGAKVGDLVTSIGNQTDTDGGQSYYESTISVADQIQQTSNPGGVVTYHIVLLRAD